MKAKNLWIQRLTAAALIGGASFPLLVASTGRAQVGVSVGIQINSPADFYAPLSGYGSWIDYGPYGRCWRPADIDPSWRPYEDGHWEWTDAGWYWVSDEPWAWACYHYGSWVFDANYGWMWIPGTEWAPAWVVWREAPEYVGWAPCGPGGVPVSDSVFMFVDVHHFHDHLGPRDVVFNDPAIFRRSRVVGGFRRETRDFDGARRKIAFNQGPAVETLQRASGARFTQRPVTELVRETRMHETARRNGTRPEQQYQSSQRPGQQPAGRTEQQRRFEQQNRLYREAPQAQPAPTGRQEPRIYREAPSHSSPATPPPRMEQPAQVPRTQPAPEVPQVPRRQALPDVSTPPAVPRQVPEAPTQVPRRQPLPEASTPSVPHERSFPPAASERGHGEAQVPRREESVPRAVPPPIQREQAPPAQQNREHERDRQGQ